MKVIGTLGNIIKGVSLMKWSFYVEITPWAQFKAIQWAHDSAQPATHDVLSVMYLVSFSFSKCNCIHIRI